MIPPSPPRPNRRSTRPRRFGTVLENVVMDPVTRTLDFDSAVLTENTRGAYPIEYIDNIAPGGVGGHPRVS